jgi:hypothetical protein
MYFRDEYYCHEGIGVTIFCFLVVSLLYLQIYFSSFFASTTNNLFCKVFNLPASSVIILERMRNIRSGDVVFAVYPDTTSFYQGTIAQQPRKAVGGGMFVTITFLDDEDAATGETHDKAVLLKHVMSPPY